MTEPDYNRVSGILTSYWKGAVVYASVKVGIFDALSIKPMTKNELVSLLNLDETILGPVLDCLEFMKLLETCAGLWNITKDGSSLVSNSPGSLSKSAIMWWQEHLDAWRNLDYSLTSGAPSFEKLFGKPFFQWLEDNPNQRVLYQKSMSEYAQIDYQKVPDIISQYNVRKIIDVGGGQGTLAQILHEKNPTLDLSVLDLPEVISDVEETNSPIHFIEGDFFNLPSGEYDAVILTRILHDWDDSNCTDILNGIRNLLKDDGYIFVIERLTECKEHSLLKIDLKIINNGKERSLSEYRELCENTGYKILRTHSIQSSITVLVLSLA